MTVYCWVIIEIALAIRTERSAHPVAAGTIEHYRSYNSAPNGIVAYLPTRFKSMPWALQRVHPNNPFDVVAAYMPNQYATPESKPWALPSRYHDSPNVVTAYLPAQYSSVPWRLPLQTSVP